MKPWEAYSKAADPVQSDAGPWAAYAAPGKAAPADDGKTPAQRLMQNLGAGLVRGAGSIGATLLAPMDMLNSATLGRPVMSGSNERRQGMDAGLSSMGADTESGAYAAGKLGAEIAGTMGAGGAVAKGLEAVPAIASKAPGLVAAVKSSGFAAPGAGIGTRAAGGAIAGGTSAALVNPEDAAIGAAIGGALPGVAKVAGAIGRGIGGAASGAPASAEAIAAAKAAQEAGYVIPPTQVSNSIGGRLAEGLAGKITTAQNASARNQKVTNALAAKALGLPAGTTIDDAALKSVRDVAGQAYEAVKQAGTVAPGKAYDAALDAIAAPHLKAAAGFPGAKPSSVIDLVESLRTPAFDAASAVEKVKELRSAADDAFRAGNTDIGRAARSASAAIEDALEGHLKATGQTGMLDALKSARKIIAKTYSVEKALNKSTGTVDARKLAAQLQRGKPLDEELRKAAEFAGAYPKAAQTPEMMGSLPQISPLDFFGATGLSMLTQNPMAMASLVARPLARSAVLSGPMQRGLVSPSAAQALQGLGSSPLTQAGYLAAPVAISSSRR